MQNWAHRTNKRPYDDRNASPICDACSAELTIDHIIISCIEYDNIWDELKISRNIDVALSNTKDEEMKLIKFWKKNVDSSINFIFFNKLQNLIK